MRFAFSLMSVCLLLNACHSKPKQDDKHSIQLQLEGLREGLALTGSEVAVVTDADLICDDGNHSLAFDGIHPVEVYRDISGCSVLLKKFTITSDAGSKDYSWSRNYTQDIGVFDAIEGGSVVDRKLARQVKTISESSCQTVETCDFRNVTLIYQYSELKAFEVELKNSLKISKLSVNAELEPAPECDVSAQFVDAADPLLPPSLHINLSNCVNTLQAGQDLEYGMKAYASGDTYLIDALHDIITGQGSRSFTPPSHQIILSLEDIKTLTGESDTFVALQKDFILPLRNKGGISMAYYVIDNSCGDLPPPPPPAPAQGFKTFTQGGWHTTCRGSNPGCIRDQYFASTFPSGVLAGDGDFQASGDSSFGIRLSSSASVMAYLAAGGTAGFLGHNYLNPSSVHEEGVLGTQLITTILNIEYDRKVFSLTRPGGQLLENLVYQKVGSPLHMKTVKQIRQMAESALAGLGNPEGIFPSAFSSALTDINENFDNGTTNNGLLFLP